MRSEGNHLNIKSCYILRVAKENSWQFAPIKKATRHTLHLAIFIPRSEDFFLSYMSAFCFQFAKKTNLRRKTPTKLQQNDCDAQQQKAIYDIDAPVFLYEETSP